MPASITRIRKIKGEEVLAEIDSLKYFLQWDGMRITLRIKDYRVSFSRHEFEHIAGLIAKLDEKKK